MDNFVRLSHSALAKFIFKIVTIMQCTPSYFKLWSQSAITDIIFSQNSTLKSLILGGEQFPSIDEVKLWQNWTSTKRKRIFNIYGITEVSCWATINEIKSNDLIANDDKTHIGTGLDCETILELRDMESGKSLDCGIGELFIGSERRICLIDSEPHSIFESPKPIFRATGDIFSKSRENRLYFEGRTNETIKKFGVKINLFRITNFASKINGVKMAYCISINMKVVLFYVPDENVPIDIIKFRSELKLKLNDYEYPQNIISIDRLPLSKHGKVSIRELENIFKNNSIGKNESISHEFFDQIYQCTGVQITSSEQTTNNPKKIKTHVNSSFYELGGTSVAAIQIYHNMEEKCSIFCPKLIELLINTNNSIEDVCYYLRNCDKKNIIKTLSDTNSILKLTIDTKYFLKKCVDASPSMTKINNQQIISIGGHGHFILNIDVIDNKIISTVELQDRIESEVNFFNQFGIVGCYDGFLICFDVVTGDIKWKFNSHGMIKCKVAIILNENKIVFGNYNEKDNLWCVNLINGDFIWKCMVGGGKSIIASPLIIDCDHIFVATLNGDCCKVNIKTGDIVWMINVGSPVFSSPKYIEVSKVIVVAGVEGLIKFVNSINGDEVNNLGFFTKFFF